jgi:ABC-type transport system substrate-binding protein
VLDDYTLSITLLKPDESFLFVLAQPSTAIISQKAWDNAEQQIVGAGPFVPTPNESELVLVRNSEYFQADAMGNQLPYLDSIVFKFIPTKETALEEVLKGKLDLVTGIYLDPVKHLLEQHGEEFQGKDPRFVMQRNDDAASFEVYAIHSSKLLGFRENFLSYRDFSVVQMKH